jgi:hypothetical protein
MANDQTKAVYVPDDFSYLDPDRPDIGYQRDLTPEQREQFAPLLQKQQELAASGEKPGFPRQAP